MLDKSCGVLLRGLRRSIHGPVSAAVAAAPDLDVAGPADDAGVVLLDACGYEWDAAFGEVVADGRTAGLPRIVLSVPSAGEGADGTFVAEIAEREAAATAGDVRACVLRCAAFGEEFALSVPYETAGALYTAWRPEGAAWLAVSDVVDLVAEILRSDRHWGAAYDVSGPEVVPTDQVCERLGNLLGRPLHYVHLPAEAHRTAMEQVGFDARHARQRSDYMDWTTSPSQRVVSPVVERALGRPPRGLDTYLLEAARSASALA